MNNRSFSAKYASRSSFGIVASAGLAAVTFAAPTANAQFTSSGVELLAQVPGGGNDVWGYVSPAGREYAIKSISGATVFIEITDPRNPVTIGQIAHAGCTWSDMRTYDHYAYVVTECGSGIQVIDLGNIDSGMVTLTRTITSPSSSHNVSIDTDSGFMYVAGGGIFDLAVPGNPVRVATGTSWHDAQVVTYTSGQYAGRQIMFAFKPSAGMDIIDVTNKSNLFRLSLSTYPSRSITHQGWTEDMQYIYVDDESAPTRTMVFDISDLSSPVLVNTFTNGLASTNHNLFVRDGFIFEANYTSGLRVFDACDPVNPVEVGFYDTFPANNGSGFSGAWGVYPFFPSGIVIINDGSAGLFIVDPSEALLAGGGLAFAYPSGRPKVVQPAGGSFFDVDVSACTGSAVPASMMLHSNDGSGWVMTPLADMGGGIFRATFPPTQCGNIVKYYLSGDTTGGKSSTSPRGAPANSFETFSADSITVSFHDNFETNMGWTVENLGATTGDWERGVPVNDPNWAYDPISDSDGSGKCFLTENRLGNTDVDNGAVRLTSPVLDLSGGAGVTFDYFLNMTNPSGTDRLLVEINTTGGVGTWTELARIEESGALNWQTFDIRADDFAARGVTPTAQSKIRFTANDANPQSIVEAGIDAFKVTKTVCDSCPCDCNFDTSTGLGVCDILDFLAFQDGFVGADPCACDRDTSTGAGVCDIFDFLAFQDGFVQGCP